MKLFPRLITSCLLAVGAARAQEAPPHVLLLDTLDAVPIKLVSIAGDSLSYRGIDGKIATVSLSQVFGVLVAEPADASVPSAPLGPASARQRVLLVDGQEFIGTLQTSQTTGTSPADAFSFESRALGLLQIPLERTRAIELLPRSGSESTDVSEDRLSLRNGDVVTGFVESIGSSIVLSSLNDPASRSELPLASIRAVDFANPPVAPDGAFIWTRQERFQFSRASVSASGGVTVHVVPPSGQSAPDATRPLTIPLSEVRGLVFDFRGLVPLSSLPSGSWMQSPDRRWAPAPQRHENVRGSIFPDVEFVGPGEATWSLPSGALRVAGRAVLPEACRDWGDAAFSISIDSAPPAATGRLTAESPALDFNVRIPAGGKTLRIKVEGGENGPIQDRVRLERTLIRTSEPQGAGPAR